MGDRSDDDHMSDAPPADAVGGDADAADASIDAPAADTGATDAAEDAAQDAEGGVAEGGAEQDDPIAALRTMMKKEKEEEEGAGAGGAGAGVSGKKGKGKKKKGKGKKRARGEGKAAANNDDEEEEEFSDDGEGGDEADRAARKRARMERELAALQADDAIDEAAEREASKEDLVPENIDELAEADALADEEEDARLAAVEQAEEADSDESEEEPEDEVDRVLHRLKKRKRKRTSKVSEPELQAMVRAFIEQLEKAADKDRVANADGKPAIAKLQLASRMLRELGKVEMQDRFIANGVFRTLKRWLDPMPDRSLPNHTVRDAVLTVLESLPVDLDHLKRSGIGKNVMLLWKHPEETHANKERARALISTWARPVFNLTTKVSEAAEYKQAAPVAAPKRGRSVAEKEDSLLMDTTNDALDMTRMRAGIVQKDAFHFDTVPQTQLDAANIVARRQDKVHQRINKRMMSLKRSKSAKKK